jgi:magnesium chelatase family protein
MLTRVFSAALRGVDALEVTIEVNSGSGDPKIVIVGLPDTSVRESCDRVTTAIANSGYRWPRARTTVNLAPADLKKEGPSFDLPIAVGMITVAEDADVPRLERCMMAGELGLNGEVRPIKGALSIAIEARRRKKKALLVPTANAAEAAVVEGIEVFGVRSLREAYEFLTRQREIEPTASQFGN